MRNAEVAQLFETMADVMEIEGENVFRVNSYRKIARILGDMTEDVEVVAAEGRLADLPGVGKGSVEKIEQYLTTGRMEAYEKRLAGFPEEALELLRIPDVGPKTVGKLMREKGITSVDALEQAIEKGELVGMSGVGEKTIEKMKTGIALVKSSRGRALLGEALPLARGLIEELRDKVSLETAQFAGSLRRMKESVGDVDILVTVSGKKGGGRAVVEAFTSLAEVAEVLASGDTKGSIRTRDGLQVDLRVVLPESLGAALQYFTGSKEHNVKLRGLARSMGLKVNEYGVLRGEERVAGATEEDVYAALGLPLIPPELREDRGEIEAAIEGALPDLIEPGDIRCDLHAHTDYSDGAFSVLSMARAAKTFGYSHVALTDHSKNLSVAGGLTEQELADRNEEIDRAIEELGGFPILKGTEVDILKDGTLDYDDDVLAGQDWVIASVHDNFGMNEADMTERIIRAVRSPYVHAIGHPTGRLIGMRNAYAVDVPAIVAACAETGTCLELNASPERLDIRDVVCREAKEAGVKVAINSDAHHALQYGLMQFGVATARRGWLEKGDVINCMTPKALLKFLRSMKAGNN